MNFVSYSHYVIHKKTSRVLLHRSLENVQFESQSNESSRILIIRHEMFIILTLIILVGPTVSIIFRAEVFEIKLFS